MTWPIWQDSNLYKQIFDVTCQDPCSLRREGLWFACAFTSVVLWNSQCLIQGRNLPLLLQTHSNHTNTEETHPVYIDSSHAPSCIKPSIPEQVYTEASQRPTASSSNWKLNHRPSRIWIQARIWVGNSFGGTDGCFPAAYGWRSNIHSLPSAPLCNIQPIYSQPIVSSKRGGTAPGECDKML